MSDLGIEGFEYTTIEVEGSAYRLGVAGSGPAVLLLHGFPQYHYRAVFHLDRAIDAEDRATGRRIGCPVLVQWGGEEEAMSDGPLPVWRAWADDVQGGPLPSGHFIPEEAAVPLTASLERFLA